VQSWIQSVQPLVLCSTLQECVHDNQQYKRIRMRIRMAVPQLQLPAVCARWLLTANGLVHNLHMLHKVPAGQQLAHAHAAHKGKVRLAVEAAAAAADKGSQMRSLL
jgi:hypothetical protein